MRACAGCATPPVGWPATVVAAQVRAAVIFAEERLASRRTAITLPERAGYDIDQENLREALIAKTDQAKTTDLLTDRTA